MKKLIAMLSIALALACSLTAKAQMDEEDFPVLKAPQVSLDIKRIPNGARILVTLEGDAYPTLGAAGTLTLTRGKRQEVLQLAPYGASEMRTRKPVRILPGTRAHAVVTFADKSTADAQAVIK